MSLLLNYQNNTDMLKNSILLAIHGHDYILISVRKSCPRTHNKVRFNGRIGIRTATKNAEHSKYMKKQKSMCMTRLSIKRIKRPAITQT